MDSFFGLPNCQYRLRCAVKSTYRGEHLKRPSHPVCNRCPFIPRLLDMQANAAVQLSRNIDVILTQSDDSTTDS